MIATYAAIATRTFYVDNDIAAGTVRTIPVFSKAASGQWDVTSADMASHGVFSDALRGIGAYAPSKRVNL
jgi:hypothetical protein